jgi:hypothetical protein
VHYEIVEDQLHNQFGARVVALVSGLADMNSSPIAPSVTQLCPKASIMTTAPGLLHIQQVKKTVTVPHAVAPFCMVSALMHGVSE